MSETKRTRHINFRVTYEEYREIERAAVAAGYEPKQLEPRPGVERGEEGALTGKSAHLIYTELAILRFLIGHELNMLFSRSEGDAAA